MKLIKQLGVTALAATLMIGCGGAPAPVIEKPKELPAWFTNPQQNDAHYLYGVGGGSDDQEAKAKALAAMIEKLSVSVQSSFEKQTIVTRHGRSSSSDETLKSDIKTEVGKIGISNYEVEKSEKLGYKNFVAMVKADKQKLAVTLKKSLKAKMDALDAKINAIASQDVLKQLFAYTEAYESAQGMTTEIMVTGELDQGFKTSQYLNYINTIYKKYLDAKNRVQFNITSSYDAQPFADKIKNALAQDYTVVNSGGAINIRCSVNMNTERSPIGMIATINVKIDVLSGGKKIGGNVVLIKAKAKSNPQASLNRGALSFGKEIKEKGIISILGIRL